MEQGIYLHIPFCRAKCRYCSFNSYPVDRAVPDEYVAALLADVRSEAEAWAGAGTCRFATVYFGGGTPSLLEERQVAAIMDELRRCYTIDPRAEVTLECNPATIDREKMAALAGLGVTRLSIGVQSLADRDLAMLGRIHTASEALAALEDGRATGFRGVSADIMVGLPGQPTSHLAATLEGVLSLVTHVSMYILSVEAGTRLERDVALCRVAMPDDQAVVDLISFARARLAGCGFEPYEISNYSLPGCRCRHNEIYWRRGNYAGFGAGAHAHRDGWRYAKVGDPGRYIASIRTAGSAIDLSENLTSGQMLLEEIMLAMRTERGLDVSGLANGGLLDGGRLGRVLEGLLEEGYVVRKGNFLALSAKGVLVGDAVVAEIAALLPPVTPDSC